MSCPSCGARYDGTRVRLGTKVRCSKCKAVFEAGVVAVPVAKPVDKLVGRTIGGYEILEKIGVGGIGAVYKARQISLDRVVAFKTLKPEFAQNQSFITRLTREARASARLAHTNIVQTYDVAQDQGISFIVMEFVEGETLQDRLTREGRADVKFAVGVLEQATLALAYARQADIVHRDIKPDNLMIAKDGTVKVADFGLAKRRDVDVSLTQSGTIVGTPRYMSPEQGNGEPLDFRSDIYSLGASIYHALAGSPPFDAPTAMAVIVKHINDPLPPLRMQNPRVPPKLAAVIETMMAKSPAARYQRVEDLLAAIEDVKRTLDADIAAAERGEFAVPTVAVPPGDAKAPSATAVTAVPSAKQKVRRRGVKLLLASLLLLLALALVSAIQKGRRAQEYDTLIGQDFEERMAAAQEFHNQEKFQDAMDAFDGFPPEDAPDRAKWLEKAQKEKDKYLGFARTKFETQAKQAQEALANGDFQLARHIYQGIVDSFGVPVILEEAKKQLDEVTTKQSDEVAKQLSELEKHMRAHPTDYGGAQELYSQVRAIKGDLKLSDEIEQRLAALGRQIEAQRGGAKVLVVSQKGIGGYRSISEAVRNVFGGDTIEIRDSAVYEEPAIASPVRGVTVRGAEGCAPVLRLLETRAGKKDRSAEPLPVLAAEPAVRVSGDWVFERMVFDLSKTFGGIYVEHGGELTLRSCAVLNIGAYGVAAGSKALAPEQPQRNFLKISDCILTAAPSGPGGHPPKILFLAYSRTHEISVEFTHNVVCGGVALGFRPAAAVTGSKVVVDSNIFEGIETVVWSAGPLLGAIGMQFDYNCYSSPPQEYYASLLQELRRLPRFAKQGKAITRFADWQEAVQGDQHSIEAAAGLVAPEKGDFSLRPDSPCLGKGRTGTPMGLLTARRLPAGLFAGPAGKEEKPKEQVAETPPPPGPTDQLPKTDQLILDQRYDEAIELIQKAPDTDPNVKRQRVKNIECMKDLKALVLREINAGRSPSPPSSLLMDKYSHFVGGSIVSATPDSFTLVDKNNGSPTSIKWTPPALSPEQFLDIARKCTSITDGREQLMLGVFCFEVGLTEKARTYLGYAKISSSISAEDRKDAEDLYRRIERTGGKPSPGAAQRKDTPPPAEAEAEALRRIQELFEEGRFKDALDQADALLRASPEDTRLKYRLGFLLWEFAQTRDKRSSVSREDHVRLWKTTWQLLNTALSEGGKLPGSQNAQEIIQKMKEMGGRDKEYRPKFDRP